MNIVETWKAWFSKKESDQIQLLETQLMPYLSLSKSQSITLIFSTFFICFGIHFQQSLLISAGLILYPFFIALIGLSFGLLVFNIKVIIQSIQSILLSTIIIFTISALYLKINPIFIDSQLFNNYAQIQLSDYLASIAIGIIGFIALYKSFNLFYLFIGFSLAVNFSAPIIALVYGILKSEYALIYNGLNTFMIKLFLVFFSSLFTAYILGFKQKIETKNIQHLVLIGFMLLIIGSGLYISSKNLKQSIVSFNTDEFIKKELTQKSIAVFNREIDLNNNKIDIYYNGVLPENARNIEVHKIYHIKKMDIQFHEIN